MNATDEERELAYSDAAEHTIKEQQKVLQALKDHDAGLRTISTTELEQKLADHTP